MHKTLGLAIDWLGLTYVQNIFQLSFVGPFDVIGHGYLPAMPRPMP